MSSSGERTFTFCWQGPSGSTCELIGDVPGWNVPVPMPEVAPGRFACTLALEPGVYRYKLFLNGRAWLRDPNAHATDVTESHGNGLFIVEGAAWPLLFAPDRRHLVLYEDGRLVIHIEDQLGPTALAAVEVLGTTSTRGDGAALCEDPGTTQSLGCVPLTSVHTRNGRVMLRGEATFDLTRARPVALRLDGREAAAFPVPAPRSRVAQPPEWARRAVLYAIFVDRWHRSVASLPDPRASSRDAPSTSATFFGGDLAGITESLDYLKALGVDGIVLTPVHTSPSPHRYDATDLLAVDPLLGGEGAFGALVAGAHARGLRIVADLSVTHVNEAHPAFQSLLCEQQASPYASWFRVKCFPVRARDVETVDCYPRRPYLPWLNLEDRGAREHAMTAALSWIRRGVDGLRLDAMHDAPADFWCELRAKVRAENPEALVLGEVIFDRPGRYAEERGLDMATNFVHREALLDFFFKGETTAAQFWERLAFHQFRVGPFEPSFHLLFLDNHDTARVLGPHTPYARLRLALTYLLLRPEPLWLNYGTEMALCGSGRIVYDEAWDERPPMPPLQLGGTKTQALVQQLLTLRRELPELASSLLTPLSTPGRLLAYDRGVAPSLLRVVINAGSEPASLDGLVDAKQTPLIAVEEDKPGHPLVLPAGAARVYRVASDLG